MQQFSLATIKMHINFNEVAQWQTLRIRHVRHKGTAAAEAEAEEEHKTQRNRIR